MQNRPLHEWLITSGLWASVGLWFFEREELLLPMWGLITVVIFLKAVFDWLGSVFGFMGRAGRERAERRRKEREKERERKHQLRLARASAIPQKSQVELLRDRIECLRIIHQEKCKLISESDMEPDEKQAALALERQRYEQQIAACG